MAEVRWLHPGDRLLSTDPATWSFRDLCQAVAMLDTDGRIVEHLEAYADRPEVHSRLAILARLITDDRDAPFSQVSRAHLERLLDH